MIISVICLITSVVGALHIAVEHLGRIHQRRLTACKQAAVVPLQRLQIRKGEDAQSGQGRAAVIEDTRLIAGDLVRAKLNGPVLAVEHLSEAGQTEVSLVVEGEIALAGIASGSVCKLHGKEAVAVDGEIQRKSRRLKRSLGVIRINVAGGPDVALAADLLAAVVFVAHAAVHHLVEGAGRISILLVARCGNIYHIVRYNIQILLVASA